MKHLEDVHAIAEAYLNDIGAKNIPTVIHGTRFKHAYYGEDTRMLAKRIEAEKEQRHSVEAVPETFVIQSGKKFFYGFKGNETKWTYDKRLAFVFNHLDIDETINDLESLGFAVLKHPVVTGNSSL